MIMKSALPSGTESSAKPIGRSNLTVDARQMRVMDKDVSDKDRAEIQETMLGPKVLDTAQFPEIRFRSTAVEPAGDGRWTVSGDLTLHGQTHPVKLEVRATKRTLSGHRHELKQKDFGIEPIIVGGGAVKVKNELRVEFDIVAKTVKPRLLEALSCAASDETAAALLTVQVTPAPNSCVQLYKVNPGYWCFPAGV